MDCRRIGSIDVVAHQPCCCAVVGVAAITATANVWQLEVAKKGSGVEGRTCSSGDRGRCSRIGRDVLREGGHAIHASVAAALCLGVVSPASSGIGGGGFMLIRSASNGMTQAFDMRETAPLLSSQVPF